MKLQENSFEETRIEPSHYDFRAEEAHNHDEAFLLKS